MVIYHIDMVILDIDMGYRLMIWEMTVSIRSSPISIWDILSLPASCCLPRHRLAFTRHAIDTYFEPSFPELHGSL